MPFERKRILIVNGYLDETRRVRGRPHFVPAPALRSQPVPPHRPVAIRGDRRRSPVETGLAFDRRRPSTREVGSAVMRVLVTNDDGVESDGIVALARSLHRAGHDVFVVAPASDLSGAGASIGPLHRSEPIPVAAPGAHGRVTASPPPPGTRRR